MISKKNVFSSFLMHNLVACVGLENTRILGRVILTEDRSVLGLLTSPTTRLQTQTLFSSGMLK